MVREEGSSSALGGQQDKKASAILYFVEAEHKRGITTLHLCREFTNTSVF